MNTITNHQRPGVFSAYEASSVINRNHFGQVVGIAFLDTDGTNLSPKHIYTYEEAVATLGASHCVTSMVKLVLQNGASSVVLCSAGSQEDYLKACTMLCDEDSVRILLCDSTSQSIQDQVVSAVEDAEGRKRECIAVLASSKADDSSALMTKARAINSKRAVLLAPCSTSADIDLAASVAGAIAMETDPAVPLGGATLDGISDLTKKFTEDEIDALIRAGVTVVERSAGDISIVRAMTTKTQTDGLDDPTWREMSTIRIVDDVIPSIRSALRIRFARAKNTLQIRNAIRSHVIMELEHKKSQEIITQYGEVTVEALADDPSVCLVDFSFTVAHGLNQIWLKANITV